MKFSTLTVATVISGKMLARIDEIYKILDYMTGDAIFTHQIPRAMKTCRPELQKQFPDLAAAIDPAAINEETAAAVSGEIVGKFGPELEVAPLPAGEWQPKDPIEELLDMQTKDPE